MSDKLLDEYVKVTKTIDNIHEKINRYKHIIEKRIDETDDEDIQTKYLNEFRKFIEQIKNDDDITQKYRFLRNKQRDLRNQLTMNDVDKTIFELKSKYGDENYDLNKISLRTRSDINMDNTIYTDNISDKIDKNKINKFDILLNDIQKNLQLN